VLGLGLIEAYWDEILRFVATIKRRVTSASQLFKRLNSYARQHPLYIMAGSPWSRGRVRRLLPFAPALLGYPFTGRG